MTGPVVETLVLTATDVARCLPASECREALSRAFALLAEGVVAPPRALTFDARGGGFHAKACMFEADPPRFVTKVNGNFPGNPGRNGLPTVQGVVVLADGADGRPLAILDSASLTAIRTAAASALAAGLLCAPNTSVAAIVGCGRQGAEHVEAFRAVRPIEEIRLFDIERGRAEALAARVRDHGGPACRVTGSVADATRGAHLIATCTPGAAFVLGPDDVAPGSFVAAVGTDYAAKREIEPSLLARARVVVDDLDQCAASGDLHHALEAGVMRIEDVSADLALVVTGARVVRTRADDIVIFDSTGIALEDVAAADLAYERALALGAGRCVVLAA